MIYHGGKPFITIELSNYREHTLSPVATNSLSGAITGKPAPTVASFKNLAPLSWLALKIFAKSSASPENAFLLGVMTLIPAFNQAGYMPAISSDEVLSTNATRSFSPTSCVKCAVKVFKSAASFEDASRDFQGAFGLIGLAFPVKRVRDEEESETSLNGEDCGGMERS